MVNYRLVSDTGDTAYDLFRYAWRATPSSPLQWTNNTTEGSVTLSTIVGIRARVIIDANISPEMPHDPLDPAGFSARLAEGINRLVRDPELRRRMGAAGRQRVLDNYSWHSIAEKTLALYKSLRSES